ncbi:MAG: hypothetical protein GDA43_17765 [Hormoscilla sp. SP5CHS1]|nr:hypothetical protein [Hormoscilla sp. SP5CHS1]
MFQPFAWVLLWFDETDLTQTAFFLFSLNLDLAAYLPGKLMLHVSTLNASG